jgi:choline dehydrogenase-like flavoprotein
LLDIQADLLTRRWASNLDGPEDWNIISEKGSGINNRQVKLSRGKFLGGSSGLNGTLCIKGSKQDYDDWGLPGWSGEEFFGYMQKVSKFSSRRLILSRHAFKQVLTLALSKAETFHEKPWFKAHSKSHGYRGPLHTEPHDLAPISNLVLESMISKGLPLDDDMFSHGENPHGCGHAPRTVHKGIRTTGACFITKSHRRDNIVILCETYVDKVLFQDVKGEVVATGVRAVSADGVPFDLTATKEVVISGGAYCSPNILQRSGIGAKDELAALSIPSVVNLPGVGKNLMDHLIVFMFYEVSKPGLTTDHLAYHDDALAKSYKLWKESKTGFLSSFPFGSFGFARLDDRLADSQLWNSAHRTPGRDPMRLTPKQPNIEFFHTECYGGPKQYDKFPVDHKHAFAMIAELFAPRSRGKVELQSTNPLDGPKVDCGYLQDPLDVEVLAEACRFGNEIIVGGKGTKDVVKGSWPPDLTHHTYTTREEWIPYVKDNATTCKTSSPALFSAVIQYVAVV